MFNLKLKKSVLPVISASLLFLSLQSEAIAQGTGSHGRIQQQQGFCYQDAEKISRRLENLLQDCAPDYDSEAFDKFHRKLGSPTMLLFPVLYKHGVKKAFSELESTFENSYFPEASPVCAEEERTQLQNLRKASISAMKRCTW